MNENVGNGLSSRKLLTGRDCALEILDQTLVLPLIIIFMAMWFSLECVENDLIA